MNHRRKFIRTRAIVLHGTLDWRNSEALCYDKQREEAVTGDTWGRLLQVIRGGRHTHGSLKNDVRSINSGYFILP